MICAPFAPLMLAYAERPGLDFSAEPLSEQLAVIRMTRRIDAA
jgi:hypothetical protein